LTARGALATKDWNPGAYAKFRGLRLRPALDLLAQVGDLPPGDVIDLGCGDGAALGALARRFPDRACIGVDASRAMLEKALGYSATEQADIATWSPKVPPALIFSNAVLHWLPDHATLLPRLAGFLAPKGILAVQMPRQFLAPSHQLLRDIAVAMFPGRFNFGPYTPPTAPAVDYHGMLSPLGCVSAWETDYIQQLAPVSEGHPVRAFTESTAMRPFLERLSEAEAAQFIAAYDAALTSAYPLQPDGGALFPFRRCFFVLEMP
jgi:trans-aconitate 2-methyltransferase